MKKFICVLLLALPLAAGAEVIWQSDVTPRCGGDGKFGICIGRIDVGVGVWPVAGGHTVSAVYTQDGWASFSVKQGSWVENVNNPYGSQDERWLVEIPRGSSGFGSTLKNVEYALFVENWDGYTSWDNNNGFNYYYGN